MAMIKCHECGNQISSEASACPQCGAKPKKQVGILGIIFAGMLGLLAFQCSSPRSTPITPAQPTKPEKPDLAAGNAITMARLISASAKDPSSVKWSEVVYIESGKSEGHGSYCFEYRAKNSFNALVVEHAAFVVNDKGTQQGKWEKHCAGKSGRSMIGVIKILG